MITDFKIEKKLSSSEAKYTFKTKGFIVESVREGGAQASINIPSEFFNHLRDNNVLIKSDVINKVINLGTTEYEAFELVEKCKFQLIPSEDFRYESEKELGFFVIVAMNTKPQIRPRLYNLVGEKYSDKDFKWLSKLLEVAHQNGIITLIFDSNKKKVTFRYSNVLEEVLDSNNLNISEMNELNYNTSEQGFFNDSEMKNPLQVLYFGAPGTGKSYNISKIIQDHAGIVLNKNETIDSLPNVFRTTMFLDFSYHDFIGSIMPIIQDSKPISYDFVPGIFTKALVYSFSNPSKNVYLVIEEMSRANMANIFGDIFQLLDRDKNGQSIYTINNDLISREISKENLGFFDQSTLSYKKIYIPKNMSIIGTINSTDQNVFVMDTAFKRRFEFRYVSTHPVKSEMGEYLNNFKFKLQGHLTNWIDLYQIINKFILEEANLSEDKQIGQFFIIGSDSTSEDYLNQNTIEVKNKLLNYLWFDVNSTILSGKKIFNEKYITFSQVFENFESYKETSDIFNFSIEEK